MDWIYTVGIVVSILVMILGIGTCMYCVDMYQNKRTASKSSNAATIIAIVIAVVAIVLGVVFFKEDTIRWVIAGCALMLVALTMIIGYVADVDYGKMETEPEWSHPLFVHLLFIMAVAAIPVGHFCGTYVENKQTEYKYINGETKTIAAVKILPVMEMQYEYVDGGHAQAMLPKGKKSVNQVFLIMTDGTIIALSRQNENLDYKMLYPVGDTIRIYKGKPVELRY